MANNALRPLLLPLLLLLSLYAAIAFADSTGSCVYTVYVRTGSIWKGGTDSNISLSLKDSFGEEVYIANIEAWGGLMGPGYNYFERGNLDIFSGRGPCLSSPVCRMILSSDGTGPHHGWYCNYVEITSTGPHVPCQEQLFTVEQWLATDVSPYDLTADRDHCSYDDRQTSLRPTFLQS